MSEELDLEEYEPVIVDLDGEEFELIDMIELDGKSYAALTPYVEDDDIDGEEVEFIILEVIDNENNEEQCTLKTIDDEELYSKVGDAFMEMFSDKFGDEE